MLGGVVVAGTVAAGTTAFTAAGLDATSATTTIGGQVDIQTGDIDGLTLDSVAATWDTATPAKITHMMVTFGAGAADGTPVTLKVNDGNGNHPFTCLAVATLISDCSATAPFAPSAVDHIIITA